jgi:hypothetical protein
MKINKDENEVTFTFARYGKRSNPYNDSEGEEYPLFTGLIIRHRKNGKDWDEMGFAATIDMDYKGKPDQTGDFIVKWHGSEEDLIKECEELNIGVDELIS